MSNQHIYHIILAPYRVKHKLRDMFDLDKYLEDRSRIVDAALDGIMPRSGQKPAILHKAMRYSVFSGGKRIRPVLCLAAAEAVGSSYREALLPAAAIELLHTYTLIHDDLPCMDNDDFRRGKLTSHKVFGEANAILAGDALQTLAFETIARTPVPSPYKPGQLVSELANAAGSMGVAGGQVEDLAAADSRQTRKSIEFIHQHKTADLFRASLRIGAIAGGSGRKQLTALTQYGTNLGLAFQITDDILDKPEAVSRPAGKSKKMELSCLSVFSPDKARMRARELIDQAVMALRGFQSHVNPLISIAQFVLNRTR